MHEALDERTPLLERLIFCNIFTSNLDEFFMKRIGVLKDQIEYHVPHHSHDGKTPEEQLLLCRRKVNGQIKKLTNLYEKKLLPALKQEKILLLSWEDLSLAEKKKLRDYFKTDIFPILTPLVVDFSHPFPFISNLSKSLALSIKRSRKEERTFARVKIPTEIPQWKLVSEKKGNYRFINIDQIVKNNINLLYPGMKVADVALFRVTRNAAYEEDNEETQDVLELVEEGLKERKFSSVLRLEHEPSLDPWLLRYLKNELELGKSDVYITPSLIHFSNFDSIYKQVDRPDLKKVAWTPKTPQDFLDESLNIFNLIKKKDYLIHHPYESFSSTVERFLETAASDPKVLAIKLTIYRTDHNSQIIRSLMRASESGKQVACVVELKARFEEKRNISWASQLESAGVHVIYGMVGLKTHCKMALVVRRDHDGMTSYAHIGTGNYNAHTAKLYTDLSFFTCDKKICYEVVQVFNYLTGISLKEEYQELLVAPSCMKKRFLQLIERECQYKKNGHIIAKMNSLEDQEIIRALYKASQAGVKIDLIIRGLSCLRPAVKGLSENIRVISIIGRFLEHSRIFYFSNGHLNKDPLAGDFFIGSADWMHRNLNNRIEVMTPLKEKSLKEKTWDILRFQLEDQRQAWELNAQGVYKKRRSKLIKEKGVQQKMMDLVKKRNLV